MDTFLKKHITRQKNELSHHDQLRFLKRLHHLLTNGYPIIEALDSIAWDKRFSDFATHIMNELTTGASFDQALKKASFHPSITNYLAFAMSNQNLSENIKRSFQMFEQRLIYRSKFRQAIRYPILLLFIFLPILFMLKQIVIPSFIDLYRGTPGSSAILVIAMTLIDWLLLLLIITTAALCIFAIGWNYFKRNIPIDKQVTFYARLPIYRNFLTVQTSFLFATQFSTLIQTGLPFKAILQQMMYQKKQPLISYYARLMTAQLTEGRQLPSLLSQLRFLDTPLANIFQKDSNTATLEKDLNVYAESLMEETERRILKMLTYIQPVFFIIIGCFVLFIYMTLMWPMFQLIKTI
ncbi:MULTISPECIES: competence type IV pilus assembly protein ComGB [Clostridia]|uniref:competence type IV pilus assembly protein ComGB n=1 Tax=Clostridia TaxID=186801 RepID=UPI001314A524|nr:MULTISPECIES: competence type IV pilus assembly protein ComGB [Clostridia]